MNRHTKEELKVWQKLPLDEKIRMTKMRIAQWYRFYDDDVYVSFSGGKDSTVLLDMCREMYDVIDAVFVNTHLEYPEIEDFVMRTKNVTIIEPKMRFVEVVKKYGYPLFSKEVAECVSGSRKYLKSLTEQLKNEDALTDRQTDRPYHYEYEKLCGLGKYAKPYTRGG